MKTFTKRDIKSFINQRFSEQGFGLVTANELTKSALKVLEEDSKFYDKHDFFTLIDRLITQIDTIRKGNAN